MLQIKLIRYLELWRIAWIHMQIDAVQTGMCRCLLTLWYSHICSTMTTFIWAGRQKAPASAAVDKVKSKVSIAKMGGLFSKVRWFPYIRIKKLGGTTPGFARPKILFTTLGGLDLQNWVVITTQFCNKNHPILLPPSLTVHVLVNHPPLQKNATRFCDTHFSWRNALNHLILLQNNHPILQHSP